MKEILILHPAHWEQAMGGAELQISYLVLALKSHGFNIHFLFEDKGGGIENRLGIKLHPLKKRNIRKTLGQRWFLYKKDIHKKIDEINPDVIYTRFFSSWSGFAAEYAQSTNKMHIWAVAADSDVTRKINTRIFRRPFDIIEYYYFTKIFKNGMTKIISQNSFQQNMIKKRYQKNSIRILQMSPLEKENNIKKSVKKIKVAWIANFKPIKRPEFYIELVNMFARHKDVEFLMIGRGGKCYSNILKKVINKRFNNLGELSNRAVNQILCKTHILVNTSVQEGFSNTFVQAWMRKVIVLSMNSNPDEILTNEKIGFLCPTIESLKDKIELLLDNNVLRKKMSEMAYDYGTRNHALENNIKKIIALFEQQNI